MSKKYCIVTDYGGEASELRGRQKTLKLESIKRMFKRDEKVRLKVKNDSKKTPVRIVEGTVIQITGFLVVLETKTRKESFEFAEFLTGRAKVIA